MKHSFLLSIFLLFGFTAIYSQVDSIKIRTESEFGYSPQMRKSVLPVSVFESQQKEIAHPRRDHFFEEKLNNSFEQPQEFQNAFSKTNAGIQVNVGRNFEGNHLMQNITPSDNTVAISNDGKIVAIDNRTFAYFKENGDTITQFSLPFPTFYNDSTMNDLPFDPRVIYDSYENRFIAITLYHSLFFSESRVLLSFSNPLIGDTVTWNNYQIECDSVFTNPDEAWYWFDYPNISVTKSQFLLTVEVSRFDSTSGGSTNVGNALFQIDKAAGYNAAVQLPRRIWKNVENTENNSKINIVPAMDAFQGDSYDTTCYFVSNYTANSTKFFWFELTGDMYSPNAQLTAHSNFPAFFYSVPSYASQMGGFGQDRISVRDCDIQYCLYQKGKLHFVFTRSDNSWSELVYATIEIASNSFSASTFSQASSSLNCLRPSIASFGQDSTDENFLIAFLRTGPSIFPEICVTNFDSGWSPIPTVVKVGLGVIDQRAELVAPWDSLERWGDYTTIQRRYNDPFRRCWMVGAYPFGANPNHFAAINSVNAWIAEVGDTLPAISIAQIHELSKMSLYPNPILGEQGLTVKVPKPGSFQVLICDAQGKVNYEGKFSGMESKIPMTGFANGMYFVTLIQNGQYYESKKITLLR